MICIGRTGERWDRFQLATQSAASQHSGVAALSLSSTHMEVWWVGADGSVQGAWWTAGAPWQRYPVVAVPLSASPSSGIAALSRSSTHMEVWWGRGGWLGAGGLVDRGCALAALCAGAVGQRLAVERYRGVVAELHPYGGVVGRGGWLRAGRVVDRGCALATLSGGGGGEQPSYRLWPRLAPRRACQST